MVTMVHDKTGRFRQRPHYRAGEIDRECESIIVKFLRELYGEARFPIDTEDLIKLIERDADDLDVYADLSCYGDDVEGVTKFTPGQKPCVRISILLTEDERRQNRLRTTLTHEYGHVHFHSYLWEVEQPLQSGPNRDKAVCKRETMLDSGESDWMEWQAGYACGAILMPKSYLLKFYNAYCEEKGLSAPPARSSSQGVELITRVSAAFQVSEDAARVRLAKLSLLSAPA